MNDIILKIVNAWYVDLCLKQVKLNTVVDDIFATMEKEEIGMTEDMFYDNISDEEEFKDTLFELFPDLVFQLAGDKWFIVKEIK